MQTKIWAITDNRTGHIAQMEGVLELIPQKHRLFKIKGSFLGKCSFSLQPLGVSTKVKQGFLRLLKQNNIPEVIVVIGRRNLSLSLYLKRKILQLNKSVKVIFLMPPGKYSKNIDFIYTHSYKKNPSKKYSDNIGFLDFPPSKFNLKKDDKDIEVIKKEISLLNSANTSYIGVLVGGKAKGVSWNKESIKILARSLKKLANVSNSTLIIVTSRRTGIKESEYLKEQLKGVPYIFNSFNDEHNMYKDVLKIADILVVTGDSTSMIADCITITKNTPLLIFDDSIFTGGGKGRFTKFHKFLYKNNYAVPLKDGNVKCIIKSNKTTNSAYIVAKKIQNIIAG